MASAFRPWTCWVFAGPCLGNGQIVAAGRSLLESILDTTAPIESVFRIGSLASARLVRCATSCTTSWPSATRTHTEAFSRLELSENGQPCGDFLRWETTGLLVSLLPVPRFPGFSLSGPAMVMPWILFPAPAQKSRCSCLADSPHKTRRKNHRLGEHLGLKSQLPIILTTHGAAGERLGTLTRLGQCNGRDLAVYCVLCEG